MNCAHDHMISVKTNTRVVDLSLIKEVLYFFGLIFHFRPPLTVFL